jgi:glycosyltransferase 2 family protein
VSINDGTERGSRQLRHREAAPGPRRKLSQRVMLALRILIPLVILGYLLSVVPLRDTLASLKAIPPWAFGAGLAIGLSGILVAGWRWQLLFAACGIRERPSVLTLFRLHLVAMFYNSFLPGGVGGEVVRGVAIRQVMGSRGLPGALAIVLLERTLGAAGLMFLVASTFALFPLGDFGNVVLWSGIGLCVAALAVACIVNGARIAGFLPAPLAKVAAGLPTIEAHKPFAAALALSVVTQSAFIFLGHVLLSSITSVRFTTSMVVMPLIGASGYFPLTVGGAGIREYAFVKLYGVVGVAEHDALAASLACAAIIYTVAGIGGIVHALSPLTIERPSGLS